MLERDFQKLDREISLLAGQRRDHELNGRLQAAQKLEIRIDSLLSQRYEAQESASA